MWQVASPLEPIWTPLEHTVGAIDLIPCFLDCNMIAPCQVQLKTTWKPHGRRMVYAWNGETQKMAYTVGADYVGVTAKVVECPPRFTR